MDGEVGERTGDKLLQRRYLRRFTGGDGRLGLAVFEWSTGTWRGDTVFPPDSEQYLEGMRRGALLYRRPAG